MLGPAAAVLVVLCFLSAVSNLERGRNQESKRQLEDALRRSCVACYAAEGVYPPDLAYLEEHYGVQIDEERFTVSYVVFGSNLMPDITVREPGSRHSGPARFIWMVYWQFCCWACLLPVCWQCCWQGRTDTSA